MLRHLSLFFVVVVVVVVFPYSRVDYCVFFTSEPKISEGKGSIQRKG